MDQLKGRDNPKWVFQHGDSKHLRRFNKEPQTTNREERQHLPKNGIKAPFNFLQNVCITWSAPQYQAETDADALAPFRQCDKSKDR